MQLLIELSIAAWGVTAVILSIWTYRDAWSLAFSRGWSLLTLLLGPAGLLAYLIRSRVFGMKLHLNMPEYDMRHIGDGIMASASASPSAKQAERQQPGREAPSFHSPSVSQGLPRCPKCSTAVSFYDVKCVRCGQLIRPAFTGSSV